jgi:ribosomal protein S18 acetylase RimI-like enzyme
MQSTRTRTAGLQVRRLRDHRRRKKLPTIRRATRADIPYLANTLAAAFSDYPWTRWTVPADDHIRRLEAIFTLDLTEIGLVHDEVWTTDDCNAVAVWIPPTHLQRATVDWERHGKASALLLGDRLMIADEADALIAPHRPAEPSWYLATTGVHPDHQRKGLGTAVLRPVLDRCDAERVPCLTETSSLDNVSFYQRLGFEVTAKVAMPDNGPAVWVMRRAPR